MNDEIKNIDNKETEGNEKKVFRATMCEIVSKIKYLPTREEIQKILSEKSEKGIVLQYVYILHDKDKYTNEEEEKSKGKFKAGNLKDSHWHIFLRFKYSRSFEEVANWFNIESQNINKIKARTFDKGCLYAVHANAPDRYQYELKEATANFDYASLVKVAKTKYIREKNQDKAYQRKMEIVNLIDQGVYNKFNLSKYISAEDEVNFNSAIKIAFDRRYRYLASLTERDLTCIYISGDSGAGKSSLASVLCEGLGLTYKNLNGGSTSPFDSYGGEDAIILNDIDFNTFDWKEFLNLTDNNYATLARARYHDVAIVCKVLIITTTKDPFELVKNIYGAENEEKKQFYRRFKKFYKVSYDKIKEFDFNEDIFKYELVKEIDNTLLPVMKEKARRKENKRTFTLDVEASIKSYASKHKILDLHKKELSNEAKEKKTEIDLIKIAENGYQSTEELLNTDKEGLEDFFA